MFAMLVLKLRKISCIFRKIPISLSYFISVFASVFFVLPSVANAVTPEQRAYINRMSPDELYNTYAIQVMQEAEFVFKSKGVVLNQSQMKLLTNCIVEMEKNLLTPAELRVMFIQPPNMNLTYYNQKVDSLIFYMKSRCIPRLR